MAGSQYADIKIGILTSGGDAQGMNAAVRAVVRSALAHGAHPFAILEGWAGAVAGGNSIREMGWTDVSNILPAGGTVIGTARCPEFRDYEGRHLAAKHLLERGIDRLVVIGGDGSLTGTDEFRGEWSQHVQELHAEGVISAETAEKHSTLTVVALVGSIDNDMVGTDMTIGADTALHRIVDAMDQISSTAASHQRTFIVEVMGRFCGYLPLMAAVAGGADYVFTPEAPAGPGWEDDMCDKLVRGREAGRRESIILVAEGAADQAGEAMSATRIAAALKDRTGEDARITILGHVQRGGSPSAYDRWMSTLLGYAAVQEILGGDRSAQPCILGVRHNRITRIPLMEAVLATRAVKGYIADGNYTAAQEARGSSFTTMYAINQILSEPPAPSSEQTRTDGLPAQLNDLHGTSLQRGARVAILHAGGLAPGMNTAARAAVRLGIARGWTMLGVDGSWAGLADNRVRELEWRDVEGWAFQGGAELGTRRPVPTIEEFYSLGRAIERNEIDALLVIGGLNAYLSVRALTAERDRYPAFRIPMVLVPASIDNNLPGSELSIGADTALNNAVWALDRIKESAAASRRCFVAEMMGRRCGYLTLMSGLASGAEYAYLNEEPASLSKIDDDARTLRAAFEAGRRLFLVLVNEGVSAHYDREFLATAFGAVGDGLFDVRHQALGHLQQGGAPSPYDRLLATRLVYKALGYLGEQFEQGKASAVYIGMVGNQIEARPVERMDEDLDLVNRRPYNQWWMDLRPVLEAVSLQNSQAELMPVHIADAESMKH
ncbi:6-phosphofructokinase [Schaalia sp. Marseille-Q2122]|uniref:6-phosphofructokinase n=1 Tax=Schaalia sp. Marseille-Q2122 TaxID=2736604 RepID=UPI0026DD2EEF|nr:6-phosphofructokinase [Schaalia sp. Marseille-Q2122]